MKTPTSKQLQDWTKEWQRIKQLQHLESDSANPNTNSDKEAEQIERMDGAVELLRMKHTGQLASDLGRALNEMDVVPPWQEEKKAMNRYQTDQSVLIPLTLRFLDHLKHLKDTGYAALREDGHQYGCVSPISRILAAQRDLTIEKSQKDKYAKKLKEYVNTLTERLLREREAFIERYEHNEPDYVKAGAEQDLRNLVEQCVITTSNSETRLADIDQEFSLSMTRMIDQIMQNGFYVPNWMIEFADGNRLTEDRKKIEDQITHYNLEKIAELDMDYYYELAFYNPQSNFEDRIREWLISSGAISREMVIESPANPPLQFASVSVMRSLFSGFKKDAAELKKEDVLIANAKWACGNSSYGGVRFFLEAIRKRNIELEYNDWFEMLLGAIKGHDPDVLSSAMKVILPMKELMKVDHNRLITTAINADERSGDMRFGHSRLDALQDAGIKIYSQQEWKSQEAERFVYRSSITQFTSPCPLVLACRLGYKRPVIEKLIAIAADVNDRDEAGKTALMWACKNEDEAIVSKLIEAEADLDIANDGFTALMMASKAGHEEIVSQLIGAGADVNAKHRWGETALMHACKQGHDNVVSRLLEADADVNDTNSSGETIPMIAIMRGHEDIVKQLINANAYLDRTSFCGFLGNHGTYYSRLTILQAAAIAGRQESVGILLDAGASVDARNNSGLTALMCACREGYEAVVSQLIEAEGNVDARDKYGNTALMEACKGGYDTVVWQLIEAGANVNTGLRIACEKGNESIVAQLLGAGAAVNTMDYWRETPLMYACEKGHDTVVTQLLEAGADINAVYTQNGNTALMYACEKGHDTVVTQLIEAGADVHVVSNDGHTALMWASWYGHETISEKLIQAGADLSVTNNKGETALMMACMAGNETIVTQLLEAGADVNVKDSSSRTAYDYAVNKSLENRVIALESTGTRANRIVRKALGHVVLTALAVITNTAALYASGQLDTALESASQAIPEAVSVATNLTAQALTELTTAATEIGRQMGSGPSL